MNIKERKAIIAGNWKLNKRVAEIPAFAQELRRIFRQSAAVTWLSVPRTR